MTVNNNNNHNYKYLRPSSSDQFQLPNLPATGTENWSRQGEVANHFYSRECTPGASRAGTPYYLAS